MDFFLGSEYQSDLSFIFSYHKPTPVKNTINAMKYIQTQIVQAGQMMSLDSLGMIRPDAHVVSTQWLLNKVSQCASKFLRVTESL